MPKSINAKINPLILEWARESRGLSIEEAAHKLNIDQTTLLNAEKGDVLISVSQLRKAADIYRRPIPIFYSKTIPQTHEFPDFRKISNQPYEEIDGDSRFLIRQTLQKKKIAEELYSELNINYSYHYVNLFSQKDNYQIAGQKLRTLLDIENIQLNKFENYFKSFNSFKDKIETLGVLVFQYTGINPNQMKGFVFSESPFPLIMINAKDEIQSRIFTLIHEFCHIILQKTGICDPSIILPNRYNNIEVYCNYITGEALVPSDAFEQIPIKDFDNEINLKTVITQLSRKYHVSKAVILRRLLIRNKITESTFNSISDIFEHTSLPPQRNDERGGDFYASFFSHNSPLFLDLIYQGLNKEIISPNRILRSLEIKMETLNKIQSKFYEERD